MEIIDLDTEVIEEKNKSVVAVYFENFWVCFFSPTSTQSCSMEKMYQDVNIYFTNVIFVHYKGLV